MIYLHGLGHFYPENIISNKFLEDLDIGSDSEWILERVGIENRRTVLPLDYIRGTKNTDPKVALEAALYSNIDTGVFAAREALAQAGLQAGDIGMVLCACSAQDMTLPAGAAAIASELGIEALCVDMTAGCSSFGVMLNFIDNMKPETLPDFILVLNVENTTKVVDYSDRNIAALIGDCSTAAIVSAKIPSRYMLSGFESGSDPGGWDKILIPRMGHFSQRGNAVQNFAVRKTRELARRLQGIAGERDFIFIGHQANLTMLDSVCRNCRIDDGHHWHNVRDYGNTGSTGAPSVLSQNISRLQAGSIAGIAVVGAGLTWSSFTLEPVG